jgi:hypothetical protein
MGGTCDKHWKMKNMYNTFVGKSEGQKPLKRSRSISEENIQMELEEGTMRMLTGFTSLRTGFNGGLL